MLVCELLVSVYILLYNTSSKFFATSLGTEPWKAKTFRTPLLKKQLDIEVSEANGE